MFMVQGPPGAQGPTGPRGFRGRKVSRNEIKADDTNFFNINSSV